MGLFEEIRMGNIVNVTDIINGRRAKPTDLDNRGYTTVMCAIEAGHNHIAKWLLAHGAARVVNYSVRNKISALVLAEESNNADMIALIKEYSKKQEYKIEYLNNTQTRVDAIEQKIKEERGAAAQEIADGKQKMEEPSIRRGVQELDLS